MADNPEKNIKRLSAGSGKGRDHKGPVQAFQPRAETADWVADKLRELYGEVAREPLPENLLALLRELDGQDGSKD